MASLCMPGLDVYLIWLLGLFSDLSPDPLSQSLFSRAPQPCWFFVASCAAPWKLESLRPFVRDLLVAP
jgi:hypothetical protein